MHQAGIAPLYQISLFLHLSMLIMFSSISENCSAGVWRNNSTEVNKHLSASPARTEVADAQKIGHSW